jgi:predicted metal-binding protein
MPPAKKIERGPSRRGGPRSARPDGRALEALFAKRGFTDFRWLDPREIVVAEWVRMKCLYGCWEYGKNAACPPNAPPVDACARFFREYRRAAVFHFAKKVDRPEDRHSWSRKLNLELLRLEGEVFKAGFVKAFLLFFDSCGICLECAAERTACKEPKLARPTADAMAVDVFSTVRKIGYPVQVLSDYDQEMNRYAFLLVD